MGEYTETPSKKPRGRFNPNIQWELAERLYVEGSLHGGKRVYPSLVEIATVAGTTSGNVFQRAKRHNWKTMREKFATDNPDTPESVSASTSLSAEVKPAKSSRRNAEEILLDYLDLFDRCVRRGAVRSDALADLDKAVRLLAFVRGQADQRTEKHVTVTLQSLQDKHSAYRARVAPIGDEVAGVISGADAIDTLGEAVGEAAKPLALNAGDPKMRAAIEAAWADGAPSAESVCLGGWERAALRAATGTDDD